MKAVVRHGIGDICGTDLHFIRGTFAGTKLGHTVAVLGCRPIGQFAIASVQRAETLMRLTDGVGVDCAAG